MDLLSCTCSVSSRLQGLLKSEVACGSCLIALTGLSFINLSKIPPSYLYFQPLQHPVAMCSTVSLSVVWKSCFNLPCVQHLWSRANRCLLSKPPLCCILFYNEDIPYFLHMNSAISFLSKWSTEDSFALNRGPPWQTFVHHLWTTSRTASYGTLESVHYLNWHCSLSFSQTVGFDQIPIKRTLRKNYENIYSLWGF